MTSQSNIANTSFLEDCIEKKRSIQEIHESLGLYSESANVRKEPVFFIDGANDLYKRIVEIAKAFRLSHGTDKEALVTDLAKPDVFFIEVQELACEYGQKLWGSGRWPTRYAPQHGEVPDELDFEKENDREIIRFYLRCWIIRQAAQNVLSIPRKGKGKIRARSPANSESEHSGIESPATPPPRSDLPFRASHTQKGPQSGSVRRESVGTQTIASDGTMMESRVGPKIHPIFTPNKRKSVQEAPTSAKQQKLHQAVRATTCSPWEKQRMDYDGHARSATVSCPARPSDLDRRRQRANSDDTDRTYVPPRCDTVDTETVVDEDEVMEDTRDLVLDDRVRDHDEGLYEPPTAGPSGTYHNSPRQDSVIPPTQSDGQDSQQNHGREQRNSTLGRQDVTAQPEVDVSKLNGWQAKQLRGELFKLLLSCLNGINQFSIDSYNSDAEERMNHLLYQFWTNDREVLRSRLGERFTELEACLESWMSMRHQLAEFRSVTGYRGKPGHAWKEHLRQMGTVSHAQASIAFVEMRNTSSIDGRPAAESTFNNDLATLLDLLTKVEGCNGAEEFDGLRSYNEALLGWFS